MAEPFPKSRQLGATRAKSRRWRVRARRETWAEIRAAKLDGQPCRISPDRRAEELHHLVPRSLGGDDVADNLVGLCHACHFDIEMRAGGRPQQLAERLTDAEYAYVVGKLGEGGMGRLFGV